MLTRWNIVSAAIAAGILLLGDARSECWQGDSSTGELRFAGEIEAERFYGAFNAFDVEVCRPVDGDWSQSDWIVNVATGSANTRNRDRDETLLGEDFFASDQFPMAAWRSGEVIEQAMQLTVEGRLTLRGFESPQRVVIDYLPNEAGIMIKGSAGIQRLLFEVGKGEFADPDFIRDRVDLEFEIQLMRMP